LLNQAVRQLRLVSLPDDCAPPAHGRFRFVTPMVADQLAALASWNWSSVAPKSMRVALGFICVIVGLQKALTLFFVWLIAAVAYTPPGAAVAIFVAVGLVRARRRLHACTCRQVSARVLSLRQVHD
jgi:hypothetical protein